MKKLSLLVLLVPFILLGQNESYLTSLTHIEIKMGHESQFDEGVKMYKKCYEENGGENSWSFWNRVQGSNTVYALTSDMENWAEMDKESSEASNKCLSLFPNFLLPHMKSTHDMITKTMPDISNDSEDGKDKVWVTYFKVNNTTEFMDVVKAVTSEVKKAEGDERAYWYSVMGGSSNDADYMVVWPFDKYAELDNEQDGVWKIYENAHGEKKAKMMRDKFRSAVDDSWAYIYDRSETLSHDASVNKTE